MALNAKLASPWTFGHQQCAQEFWNYLVETVREEMNEDAALGEVEAGGEVHQTTHTRRYEGTDNMEMVIKGREVHEQSKVGRSLIYRLFGGVNRATVECDACGYVSPGTSEYYQ